MTSIALAVAGSDSAGGAGIQADLKTFSALGVYGASAITALTAQNTLGVDGVHVVPPDFVLAQMQAVARDLEIGAIKIGMLATSGVIEAVAEGLNDFPGVPVVLDPGHGRGERRHFARRGRHRHAQAAFSCRAPWSSRRTCRRPHNFSELGKHRAKAR